MANQQRLALLLFAVLTLGSLAIKVSLPQVKLDPEPEYMVAQLSKAVIAAGYSVHEKSQNGFNATIVSAHRGNCRIMLRDATRFGPDSEAVSRQRMNSGRPIRYVRSGSYLSAFPRIRIELEWRVQRELARLGFGYPISPVIAVGAQDQCWPDPAMFGKVQLRLG